ncbi:hypothetical protein JW859_03250 [bacterium]|nr:hypothetical protein [bacterium]
MYNRVRLLLMNVALVLGTAVFSACGGSQMAPLGAAEGSTNAASPTGAPAAGAVETATDGWPAALPVDYQQPWEELDADGYVIPDSAQARGTSTIDADSEYTPGIDRFSEAGDVDNLDEASRLASGAVGDNEASHAVYRIPLGANQPGVVTTDINLRPRDDGQLSEFWFGLSDYAAGAWEWHGPYADGQVRLSLPDGNYTSELGNLFVSLVAFDGATFDVVAVSANPRDGVDTTPPPVPSAPVLTPVAGGLFLVWVPVVASDLAGYRIYYSDQSFVDANSPGVMSVDYLEGSGRFVLKHTGQTYVRLASVDVTGNESDLSATASAEALPGDALEVVLTTDLVSGLIGDTVNLTATGADSYDFDVNGDGIFEVTGNVTGLASASLNSTGIIRPRVRAISGGEGEMKALGAVSLVIMASIPPVAIAEASPNSGVIWREPEMVSVTFDASLSYDQDGTLLEYAYDPMGDGTYTSWSASDTYNYDYTECGTYLAAIRVKDEDGSIAHTSTLVQIKQVAGFDARAITRFNGTGQHASLAIVDGNPAIAMFDTGSSMLTYMRATDPQGSLWYEPFVIDNTVGTGLYASLQVINGNPAVSYYNSGPSEVMYLRADDAQGSSWTNTPVVIDGPVGLSTSTSLAYIDGNPAIAYVDSGPDILKYRRATTAAGTGDTAADWADAPLTLDASGNIGGFPSLKVISGNPAIAYWDATNQEALYRRAVNTTGAAIGNWPVAPARCSPAGVTVGGYISLLEVNGRPAVSFFESAIGSLQYIRASTSSGAVTADWPIVTIQVASGGGAGQWNSLALVNGRPAIAWVQSGPWLGLFYSRATDNHGTTWNPPVAVKSEPTEAVGYYTTLLDIDGLPVISYWNLAFSMAEYATVELN